VKGVLTRTADGYAGTVTANVKSTQQLTGMLGVGRCGPGSYDDSQELQVIGHPVNGFNDLVQSVSWTTSSANSSLEFLALEFIPKTPTSMQPQNPDPNQDTVIFCHTLIETEDTARSGMMFLPLNDSRWTMDGGGYIIALPLVGMLDYTDDTLAPRPNEPAPPPMPFKAKRSLWTVHVERL
jgi:hypothetical protein